MGHASSFSEELKTSVVTAPVVVTDLIVNKLGWKSVFILHEDATGTRFI